MARRTTAPRAAALAAAALAGATLLAPGCQQEEPAPPAEAVKDPSPQPAQAQTVTISVKGMACDNCRRGLENALKETKGVARASVDLKAERAEVGYDPKTVGVPALEQRIREAGFEPAAQPTTATPNPEPRILEGGIR